MGYSLRLDNSSNMSHGTSVSVSLVTVAAAAAAVAACLPAGDIALLCYTL
jgi:hypothetical protein